MAEQPIVRPSARVILIDATDRILLLRFRVDSDLGAVWITPGGGIEPGETPEQAAARELNEEIGLRDAVVGPCVWLRTHILPWQGAVYELRERFYTCRIERHDVGAYVNTDEREREFGLGHRSWSLEEIERSLEVFAPRNLAELLPPILQGEYPDEPFEVGI